MKISDDAMKAAYEVAKRVREGALSRTAAIEDLHRRFSLNRGSAADTIRNIGYMLKGKGYTRTNNAFATEHFLQMIHFDFGLETLNKAISSVELHLDYFETLPNGGKQPAIRKIVQKYRDIAKDEELESLAHQEHLLEESDAFNSNNMVDARDRILSAIVRRQGQPAFRRQLLTLYRTQSAISDCQVEAVLEAAHILPYQGPRTNDPSNGLLLRADLHTLFDLGLLAIDAQTMTVLISSDLKGTCYQEYAGRKLRLPSDQARRPSGRALDEHRKTRSKSCHAI
jgi:hypothetical protein